MGAYTRFTFWAEVDDEAAEVISEVLEGIEPREFSYMWRALRSSSYSHITRGSILRKDNFINANFLHVDTSCKNYRSEIEKFLGWIHPHVYPRTYPGNFAGFIQSEEGSLRLILWSEMGFSFSNTKGVSALNEHQ